MLLFYTSTPNLVSAYLDGIDVCEGGSDETNTTTTTTTASTTTTTTTTSTTTPCEEPDLCPVVTTTEIPTTDDLVFQISYFKYI